MGCTSSRAQISWTPGDENKDEVIEFIVKYNTSFDEPNVYHVGAKVKRGQHSAQINLSPYANYTFHVLARNSLGISDPSPFTQSKCETPAKKPVHDPDWVCTSSEEPNQLVIRWKVCDDSSLNINSYLLKVIFLIPPNFNKRSFPNFFLSNVWFIF